MGKRSGTLGTAVQHLLDQLQDFEAWAGCPRDPAGWAGEALSRARRRIQGLLPDGSTIGTRPRGAVLWLSPSYLRLFRRDLSPQFPGAVLRESHVGNLELLLAGALSSGGRLKEQFPLADAVEAAFGLPDRARPAPGPIAFIVVASIAEYSLTNQLATWRAVGGLRFADCAAFLACDTAEEVEEFQLPAGSEPQPEAPTVRAFPKSQSVADLVTPYVGELEAIEDSLQTVDQRLVHGASKRQRPSLEGLDRPAHALDVLGAAGCGEAIRTILECRKDVSPLWALVDHLARGNLAHAIRTADRLRGQAREGFNFEGELVWTGVRTMLRQVLGRRAEEADKALLHQAVQRLPALATGPGFRAERLAALCRYNQPLELLLHGDDEDLRRGTRLPDLRRELYELEGDHFLTELQDLRQLVNDVEGLDGPPPGQRGPDVRFRLPLRSEPDRREQEWLLSVTVREGPPGRFALPASLMNRLLSRWSVNADQAAERHRLDRKVGREVTLQHRGDGVLRLCLADGGPGLVEEDVLQGLATDKTGLGALLASNWFRNVWILSRRGDVSVKRRVFPPPPTGGREEDHVPDVEPPTENGTIFLIETKCGVTQQEGGEGRAPAFRAPVALRTPLLKGTDKGGAHVLLIDDAKHHRDALKAWLNARSGALVVKEGPLVTPGVQASKLTEAIFKGMPDFDAVLIHGSYGRRGGLAQGAAVRALLGGEEKLEGKWALDLTWLALLGKRLKPEVPIVVVTGGAAEELIAPLGELARDYRLRLWHADALVKTPGWAEALAQAPQSTVAEHQALDARKGGSGAEGFTPRQQRHLLRNFLSACRDAFDYRPQRFDLIEPYFAAPERLLPIRAAAAAGLTSKVESALAKALDGWLRSRSEKSAATLRKAAVQALEELENDD